MTHPPRAWQYALTGWSEIPTPLAIPKISDEDRVLTAFGYTAEHLYGGLGVGPCLRLWRRMVQTPQNAAWAYLGLLSLGTVNETAVPGSVQAIWFPDLPSVLAFLKEHQALWDAVDWEHTRFTLELAARKWFFAGHGHDVYDDCARCEPGFEAEPDDEEEEAVCNNPACPVHGGGKVKEQAH